METAKWARPRIQRLGADFSDAEAEEIADLVQVRGWQVAAHDYMRSVNELAYRLAIDEYGAGLRVLLPLTGESRVLVLRSGWGAVALNLADCVGQVVAMDDRASRLRFLEARREQVGVTNLQIHSGSLASRLPFSRGTFDAVILLDAFEQVSGVSTVSGLANQVAVLKAVRRVLASDGWLLLGVPNRFGFLGTVTRGEHSRTYRGYRRALHQGGYRDPQFYAPLPSQREPFFIIPLDDIHLFNHFVGGLFTAQDYRAKLEARGLGAAYHLGWTLWRVARRLRLTGLARYAVPSYLITARA